MKFDDIDVKYLGKGYSFYTFDKKDEKKVLLVLDLDNNVVVKEEKLPQVKNGTAKPIDYFIYRIHNVIVLGEYVLPTNNKDYVNSSEKQNDKFYMVNFYNGKGYNDCFKSVLFKGKPKRTDYNILDIIDKFYGETDEYLF